MKNIYETQPRIKLSSPNKAEMMLHTVLLPRELCPVVLDTSRFIVDTL